MGFQSVCGSRSGFEYACRAANLRAIGLCKLVASICRSLRRWPFDDECHVHHRTPALGYIWFTAWQRQSMDGDYFVVTDNRLAVFRTARIIGSSSHLWREGDAAESRRTFGRANFLWSSDGTILWPAHFPVDLAPRLRANFPLGFLSRLPHAAFHQKAADSA